MQKREKKKVKGWSIEEMRDKVNSHSEIDTEEMTKWRSLSQEEIDQCRKNLVERMEEEVLDKYKVEDSKRGASKGRGAPLEWRRVRRSKKYRASKWREDCWARVFSLFREKTLQHLQSKRDEAAAKNEYNEGFDGENQIKRKDVCRKPMVGH